MEVEWRIITVNKKYRVHDEWKEYEIERVYHKEKIFVWKIRSDAARTEILGICLFQISYMDQERVLTHKYNNE
jgi:ABC-type ATPase with predicted acetyltransferase domain